MSSGAFARLATAMANTKRNPAPVAGKIGAAVTHLTDLHIVPPLPVSAEVAGRFGINSPRENKVTYLDTIEGVLPDVREGDQMVIGSTTYLVQAAGEWPGSISVLEVILSEVK